MAKTIVVAGATGGQGNAVARHLLRKGFTVRALTRNPASEKARALAALGAQVVQGDMEEVDSLVAAFQGCAGVFSMQNFWEKGVGLKGEQRQALHMIEAAKKTGIQHFVQSSIAGAASAREVDHIISKWLIEKKVRASGLTYTLLRTVFFMEAVIDPRYKRGFIPMLRGLLDPHIEGHHFIAMDDLGGVAAEIFAQPDAYQNKAVQVSSDILSGTEMKNIIREVTGENKYPYKISSWMRFFLPCQVRKQVAWNRKQPWKFGLEETKAIYPNLTSFREFVLTHREKI